MLLPLLLIAFAGAAAGIVAYGTDARLIDFSHGLQLITLTRRLEWPLVTVSLLLCFVVLALVITNRRRAWWLIGLAPVVTLFTRHFSMHPQQWIVENPVITPVTLTTPPNNNEWVVGIEFNDKSYALPYRYLFAEPVVFLTDYDKRMLVLFSPGANRAVCTTVSRDLKARDLEIVCDPADTLLLYNSRLGQFIVGLTGLTTTGQKPADFESLIATTKTTWSVWKQTHADTLLFTGFAYADSPAAPVLPARPDQLIDRLPAKTPITLLATTEPAAVRDDAIKTEPVNLSIGKQAVVLLRDPQSHQLRAFDGHVNSDIFATFVSHTNRKLPGEWMIDKGTRSGWTADGKAIEGPLKGAQLKEIPLEADVYWGPLKRWNPSLTLTHTDGH